METQKKFLLNDTGTYLVFVCPACRGDKSRQLWVCPVCAGSGIMKIRRTNKEVSHDSRNDVVR